MWEKLKLVSATNEINYYWILFVSTENSYSLTVTDLLNVWIQECDEDDISIRQNKYNPQLEVELEKLAGMLRDNFFTRLKSNNLKYRLRSQGGLDIKGVCKISICEFQWLFRCELQTSENSAIILKQKLMNPLLQTIDQLQKIQEKSDIREPKTITRLKYTNNDVIFNSFTQKIFENIFELNKNEQQEANNQQTHSTNPLQEYFDNSIDSSFRTQEDDKTIAIEEISNSKPTEPEKPVDETEEEMRRRKQIEEKLTRQKRKREIKTQNAKKKKKLDFV